MFPIKVLVVLSVCNLHFCIVCGVGFLGSFFGDHTAAPGVEIFVLCLRLCHTKKLLGITPGSGRATVEKGLGVINCVPCWCWCWERLPCTGWFALCCWKEALAEMVPGGPAHVVLTKGRIPWQRVSCSVQCPSSHKSLCLGVQVMSVSHQILSLWVFHVWTLTVALLNTALRFSDPRVALRVGYSKLISCLPP